MKFNSEFAFHGDDEVDIVEGVPARYLRTGRLRRKDNRIVSQQIAENARQPPEDLLIIHVRPCAFALSRSAGRYNQLFLRSIDWRRQTRLQSSRNLVARKGP